MARSLSCLLTRLIIASALILLLSLAAFKLLSLPVNLKQNQKIEFQILPGQSLDQITFNLQHLKLIRSKEVLKIYLFTQGLNKKIQAGYFYFSPSQSTFEIGQGLTHALTKQIRLTLPEGLRRQEIANLVLDTLESSNSPHQFNPEVFIQKTATLEGRLYPDTYNLSPQITTKEVIIKLTSQFNKVADQLNLPPNQIEQIITLASLIEREAGSDNQRAEIAGILNNRLKNNWPLQVDATVQFALSSQRCRQRICDWWPRPLTKNNLTIDSPFNTYLHPDLPLAPICNPGQASLRAAANPNKTKNWFYLHDSTGKIHYAETVEQHNQNICTFLQKDC